MRVRIAFVLLAACGASSSPPPVSDTCARDSDCTLDYGRGCCWDCGRDEPLGAITNARDQAEARQREIDCKGKVCPEVDCAGPPACVSKYVARCEAGACQAEIVPGTECPPKP